MGGLSVGEQGKRQYMIPSSFTLSVAKIRETWDEFIAQVVGRI